MLHSPASAGLCNARTRGGCAKTAPGCVARRRPREGCSLPALTWFWEFAGNGPELPPVTVPDPRTPAMSARDPLERDLSLTVAHAAPRCAGPMRERVDASEPSDTVQVPANTK